MSWVLNFFSLNTIVAWLLKLLNNRLGDGVRWFLMATQGYKSLPLVLLLLVNVVAYVLAGADNVGTLQQGLELLLKGFSAGGLVLPDAVVSCLWYALAFTLADKFKTMLIADGYLRSGKWVSSSTKRR